MYSIFRTISLFPLRHTVFAEWINQAFYTISIAHKKFISFSYHYHFFLDCILILWNHMWLLSYFILLLFIDIILLHAVLESPFILIYSVWILLSFMEQHPQISSILFHLLHGVFLCFCVLAWKFNNVRRWEFWCCVKCSFIPHYTIITVFVTHVTVNNPLGNIVWLDFEGLFWSLTYANQ